MTSFKENPENRYDTEMRLKAVEGAEESHKAKMDDEERLAVPAHDESMVSDYIRNRIEPPADMVSGKGIFRVETPEQPEGEYEKDLKKLQALSEDELDKLLTEMEEKSKEGKGLFSKGNLLLGYAIDPKTLESLESKHHERQMNVYTLAEQIAQKAGQDLSWELEKQIERRTVSGFVYLQVPNFKTPIVKLYLGIEEMGNLVPKGDVDKIVNFLKRQRKLLPISSDLKVL